MSRANGQSTSPTGQFAIFGGSFDPVHRGHIEMAQHVLAEGRYHRIVFVPAGRSPLKETAIASAEHRVEMLSLATASDLRFEIDLCEVERPGPSFTVDTVREIIHRRSAALAWRKPGLILGSDLIGDFDKWKEPDVLEALVDLVVLTRAGNEDTRFHRPHHVVQNESVPISSGDVRRRIARNEPYRHLVPADVAHYIEQHGLYR